MAYPTPMTVPKKRAAGSVWGVTRLAWRMLPTPPIIVPPANPTAAPWSLRDQFIGRSLWDLIVVLLFEEKEWYNNNMISIMSFGAVVSGNSTSGKGQTFEFRSPARPMIRWCDDDADGNVARQVFWRTGDSYTENLLNMFVSKYPYFLTLLCMICMVLYIIINCYRILIGYFLARNQSSLVFFQKLVLV